LASELRVLVVAEDSLARAGLAALVSQLPDCVVAGQTDGDEDLLDEVELYGADVAVWDLGMEPSRPLEALARLQDSGIPVIAIVPTEDVARLAWAHGVRGILPRHVEAASLAAAIKAAAQGLATIDAHLADSLASTRDWAPSPLAENLTQRELQVLQILSDGLPNKSIASELGISEHTVRFHVNSILSKLGAQSRTQAVSLAARLGLIRL
jgi:DNA-binding NarL/FixJ family response regulator